MRTRSISGDEVGVPPSGRRPANSILAGAVVQLEPVDPQEHAAELFAVSHESEQARALWTYLPYGPFGDTAAMTAWLGDCAASADPIFFVVRDRESGRAGGMNSYLHIHPQNGTIEIGHGTLSTTSATAV